jgi:predicted membrane-bound spermidine synthase
VPVLFVSLLWPTCFMGMSLPLLARALVKDIAAAAGTIGALYGWNTLGAAIGALLTTWVILPAWGLDRSLLFGVAVNLGCVACTVPLLLACPAGPPEGRQARSASREAREGVGVGPHATERSPRTGDDAQVAGGHFSFRQWLLIYTLSGFVALSLEIVWFRLLGTMLKSTAFTFGTLLTVFLAGLGGGALAGTRLVGRSRRPARTFLRLQAAVPIYAGAFLLLLVSLLDVPTLPTLRAHLGSNEPVDVGAALAELHDALTGGGRLPRNFLGLYVLLPVAMIGPPTVLMGMSFPYLQRATQIELAVLGRRVGALQLANIVGSMGGAMLTGWVALTWLGTAMTLKLLVASGAVFLWLLGSMAGDPGRARGRRLALAAMAGICLLLPGTSRLWATLHGTTPDRVIVAEDGSGLSVLKAQRAEFRGPTGVFVNGLSQSWIPFGGIHTELGALPLMLHPSPRDVAVIGLGSGDTVFSLAGRSEVRTVTCIEIIAGQLDTLRRLLELRTYPALRALLEDPRFTFVAGDGRAYLARTARRFDIIEADALRPTSAYSGNLYSVEYFARLGDRLNPGGLAVSWAPTPRVAATFFQAFPYALQAGPILVGSRDPIDFDRDRIAALLERPDVRRHYGLAGIDIGQLLGRYVEGPAPDLWTPDRDRSGLTEENSDLFPRDEFHLPDP